MNWASLVQSPCGRPSVLLSAPMIRAFCLPTTWTLTGRAASTCTAALTDTVPWLASIDPVPSRTRTVKSWSGSTVAGISAASWPGLVPPTATGSGDVASFAPPFFAAAL